MSLWRKRQIMENYAAEYAEYSQWLSVEEAPDYCESCGGFGDHGLDEEDKIYICYACGGTGK
jgi:hypothetical protein